MVAGWVEGRNEGWMDGWMEVGVDRRKEGVREWMMVDSQVE